jgi:site-specific DNA recombinase
MAIFLLVATCQMVARRCRNRLLPVQVATLRRQIASAGHVLVKEYIDDGYTGMLLTRPGLEQLRSDLKTDMFDVVYFLAADRIARRAAYQSIIIEELVKHGKKIVINGADCKDDAEGRVTLGILGVVSEFERTKIIERIMRGKQHRLQKGEMPGGLCPFGYVYVKKTSDAPATLAIQEPQATTVRTIFEKHANGVSLNSITRWLQKNEIKTKFGKDLWSTLQIKNILRCHTYTGNRHYRAMNISDALIPKHKRGPGGEGRELVVIKVPAIVTQELFDRVQARFQQAGQRYRQPVAHQLLGHMIACGECGCNFHSYRRYFGKQLVGGQRRIFHKSAYKCNWRVREKQHMLDRITRCHNPEVATHLLEAKVTEMVRDTLFNPDKLLPCLEGLESGKNNKHEHLVRQLERFSDRIVGIEAQKERSIRLYAARGIARGVHHRKPQPRPRNRTITQKKSGDRPTGTGSCRE